MARRRSGGDGQRPRPFGRPVLLAAGALALVVAVVVSMGVLAPRPRTPLPEPQVGAGATVAWPSYVAAAPPATRAVYRFALEHPGALQYNPCYCGCGAGDHTNNERCFIASRTGDRVVFDPHGAG